MEQSPRKWEELSLRYSGQNIEVAGTLLKWYSPGGFGACKSGSLLNAMGLFRGGWV